MTAAFQDSMQFQRELDAVILAAREYLRQREAGMAIKGPASTEQLQYVLRHLEWIRSCIASFSVPPARDRMAKSITSVFTDSWDPSDPLGKRIFALEKHFVH